MSLHGESLLFLDGGSCCTSGYSNSVYLWGENHSTNATFMIMILTFTRIRSCAKVLKAVPLHRHTRCEPRPPKSRALSTTKLPKIETLQDAQLCSLAEREHEKLTVQHGGGHSCRETVLYCFPQCTYLKLFVVERCAEPSSLLLLLGS